MSTYAPRLMLAAQAIDHGSDPQLAAGVHLRVLPSLELGLPVAPLVIYKVPLGPGAERAKLRSDITWRDSRGQALTAPFSVTPDNPVTGHLPATASGVCCWLELLGNPDLVTVGLPGPRGAGGRLPLRGGMRVAGMVTTPFGDGPIATASRPRYQIAASRIERIVVSGRGRVEGVRWVDARTIVTGDKPWRVLPLPIPSGARYAGVPDAAARAKDRVSRGAPQRAPLYAEPTAPDAASTSAISASDEVSRVLDRAGVVGNWVQLVVDDLAHAQRDVTGPEQPLRDPEGTERGSVTTYALGSALAAAMDPGVGRWLGLVDLDEDRDGAVDGDVIAYVVRGLWEATGPAEQPGSLTHLSSAPVPLTPRAAAAVGDELACTDFGRYKPGEKFDGPLALDGLRFETVGRSGLRIGDMLPLGAPDGTPELQAAGSGIRITLPFPAGAIRVRAGAPGGHEVDLVAYDAAGDEVAKATGHGGDEQELTVEGAGITAAEVVAPGAKLVAVTRVCIPRAPTPPGRGKTWDFLTVACATLGNPPDGPAPPQLGTPLAGAWMPAPAPTAVREIDTPVGGLAPGALLAWARRDGTQITALNPVDPAGEAMPLAAAPPPTASVPGQGELHDRAAPPEAVSYRAAQADWFGRWSGWSEVAAGAGTRPRPPRPTVNAFYEQATFGSPVPSGTLAGTIRTRVPVPPTDALAPGAQLLDHLELSVDGATTLAPLPAGPPEELEVSLAGPGLARCEQRTVTVVARWVDADGVESVDSEAVSLLCLDPRPPAQVTLPNTLQYASRPDVTGTARVRLEWTTSSDQRRFRVFYADERGLQTKLGKVAADATDARRARAQAILAQLTDVHSAPDRAAVFRSGADVLGRDFFDQLTVNPIEASGTTASFEHALPGALRIVSFYRVLAVSAANVDADFTSSPIAAYGVPNTLPPAKPVLRAALDPAAPPGQARLHVRVPPGPVSAARYRLRRSSATAADALQMAIATSGTVGDAPAGALGQEFDVIDLGPTNVSAAPLREWVRYSWRVEVQGPDEPGGGPPGDWSEPSAPVTTMLVPAQPPASATAVSVVRDAADAVHVHFEHPDELRGGSAGTYTCEVYRRTPGGQETLVAALGADAPQAQGGRAPDRTGEFAVTDPGPVPPGTSYRVVVVDPLGRRGTPSDPVVAT